MLCLDKEKYANSNWHNGPTSSYTEAYTKDPQALSNILDQIALTWQEIITVNLDDKDWEYLRKQIELTPIQAICTYLYFWKHFLQKDIGFILGIARNTVSAHLTKVKAKWKEERGKQKQDK